MAETLEFNDIYQEVKGSMVRRWRGEGSRLFVSQQGLAGMMVLFWKRSRSLMCTGCFPNRERA